MLQAYSSGQQNELECLVPRQRPKNASLANCRDSINLTVGLAQLKFHAHQKFRKIASGPVQKRGFLVDGLLFPNELIRRTSAALSSEFSITRQET